MGKKVCPICRMPTHDVQVTENGDSVDCFRCGKYTISNSALSALANYLDNELVITNITGWIRENQEIKILPSTIKKIINLSTPPIAEKATRLLVYLSKEYPTAGNYIRLGYGSIGQIHHLVSRTSKDEDIMNLAKRLW